MTLGEKIKELREAEGMAIDELANVSNCAAELLMLVEKGRINEHSLFASRLKNIADALGTTMDDLYPD